MQQFCPFSYRIQSKQKKKSKKHSNVLRLTKKMGNDCQTYLHTYVLNQPSLKLSRRIEGQVTNAPSTKYALRLKNKFPQLQPIIKQTHSKIKLPTIEQIIRDCPIYFIYEKSAVYQGHWQQGEPHGYGRVIYSDFSYYEGLFKQSEPCTFITPEHHEESIYIFPDGSYYRGEFNLSKFQGNGFLFKENSMKIVGSFRNGLPHGQVIQTLLYPNQFNQLVQSTYEGDFVNGVKQGKGKLENDKFLYVGDFFEGKPHGEGELIDYNGIEFRGKFNHGKKMVGQIKSGHGVVRGFHQEKDTQDNAYYVWQNQKKFYIGSIKEDKFDGPGKLYFENGRVVQGIWKNGHNKRVLGVEQLTQSQVRNIKKEQDQQYHEFNARSSRSEIDGRASRADYNAMGSRVDFNAQGSRADFNDMASRSEYNPKGSRSEKNGKESESRQAMSRDPGEDGSGHSNEHWHHGHGQFKKREAAILKSDMIIEK